MENGKRFIDAKKLESRMGDLCDEFCTDYLFIDAIIYEIENAPTIDAVELVNGRWVDKEDYYIETGMTCSVCGERYWLETSRTDFKPYNYCPNCGAKMDK